VRLPASSLNTFKAFPSANSTFASPYKTKRAFYIFLKNPCPYVTLEPLRNRAGFLRHTLGERRMRNKSDFPCYTFLFAIFTYIFTAQLGDKFWPFSAFADELCTRFCTAIRTRKVKYCIVATASSAGDDCVLFCSTPPLFAPCISNANVHIKSRFCNSLP
jgi:hypothetical protein